MAGFNPSQDRLFTPGRLTRFCPHFHCAVRCGAGTCKCKPCPPWCEFCRERKANARKFRFADTPEISFPTDQPRLPGAFPRSTRA